MIELTREQLIEQVENLEVERRRAEQSLAKKDKLNRHLVENSLGLMCVHDLKGNLISINPAATRSLGYEPGDGVGHNLLEYLAPDVRHLFENYLRRIHLHGVDSGVMKLVAKSGDERFWMYRNVLYEEPGAPPKILGHALDITDRVRTDHALRESEQRFRLMADAAPIMIWLADANGHRTFVNKAWLQFSGLTLDREIERGWSEAFHPDERASFEENVVSAFRGRKNFELRLRMQRADGAYRWLLHRGVARYEPDGSFAGYVGSAVDVTDFDTCRETQSVRSAADNLLKTRHLQSLNQLFEALAHDYGNVITVLLGNVILARMEPGLNPRMQDCLDEIERASQRASLLTKELLSLTENSRTDN